MPIEDAVQFISDLKARKTPLQDPLPEKSFRSLKRARIPQQARDLSAMSAVHLSLSLRPAPYCVQIPKDKLIPGPNREITEAHVRKLRRQWSVQKIGVFKVRPHPVHDGFYEIIVGGHRFAACQPLDHVVEIWCEVHEGVSDEEASELWRAEAKDRKNPTAPDLFGNLLRQHDPAAEEIARLITGVGREIAKTKNSNPRNVACISALMVLYKSARTRDALVRLFPMLGTLCEGHLFQETLVRGLVELEVRVQPDSLSLKRWQGRVLQLGYDRLLDAMTKATVNRGGHSEKHWAGAALDMLNKGLRLRLVAKGLNDPESA